jgi:hypothetical protein
MSLLVTHDRFRRKSDPTLNGNLHYPADIDNPLIETVTDKKIIMNQ